MFTFRTVRGKYDSIIEDSFEYVNIFCNYQVSEWYEQRADDFTRDATQNLVLASNIDLFSLN